LAGGSALFTYVPGLGSQIERLRKMKVLISAIALSITLAGVAFAGSTAGKPLTLQKGNSINNYQGFGSANKAHLDEPEKQK
jgi:hypothetical protein